MNKSHFVTIEGMDGCGKSTAIEMLKELMEAEDKRVHLTREPGGTITAEKIRDLLINHDATVEGMTVQTEALLVNASRSLHITNVIQPLIKAGWWVVSDRFTDSTYALQCVGGLEPKEVRALEIFTQKGFYPKYTILLDVKPEVALTRIKARGDKSDYFESKGEEFLTSTAEVFMDRAKGELPGVGKTPTIYFIVDANGDLDSIKASMATALYLMNRGLSTKDTRGGASHTFIKDGAWNR